MAMAVPIITGARAAAKVFDFFLTNSIKVVNILASLVRLTTDSIGKSLCFLEIIANGCTKLNKNNGLP